MFIKNHPFSARPCPLQAPQTARGPLAATVAHRGSGGPPPRATWTAPRGSGRLLRFGRPPPVCDLTRHMCHIMFSQIFKVLGAFDLFEIFCCGL